MANAFQIAVLYFCLAVIAVAVAACAFGGLKRVVEVLRTTLAPATLAVFLVATGVVTVIAQKRGGDEAAGTPPRSFGEVALLPLPNVVTNEKWRAHGAYQNWMHIPATNWWARSPSGGWLDRLTAFAWTDGLVYIDNPFGWHVKGTSGNTPPHKVFGGFIQDTIMLDRHGRVGVWKLNNWVIRTTNDVVTLYGPKEQEQ